MLLTHITALRKAAPGLVISVSSAISKDPMPSRVSVPSSEVQKFWVFYLDTTLPRGSGDFRLFKSKTNFL